MDKIDLSKSIFLKENIIILIFILFPVSLLLRSTIVNIYFVMISLFYLIFFFKKNFYEKVFNNFWIKILIILFFYLILRSLYADNPFNSIKSSFSQLRFLFFVLLLGSLNINFFHIKLINIVFSLIIFFVCIDTIYQYFYGIDLLGFDNPAVKTGNFGRLSGPFGDELIVGSYIFLISIPVISHFFFTFEIAKKKEKFYIISFVIICFTTILLSGERMSFILFCSSLIILILFCFGIKKSIYSLLAILCLLFFFINFNDSVNTRSKNFIKQILQVKNQDHIRLFSSAYNIWEKNKLIGVGLKNYRVTCNTELLDKNIKRNTLCSTHPHNFYFEILSETGVVGLTFFFIFFFSIINLIIKNYNKVDKKCRGFYFGCSLIIIIYIWPIKSSGSFFSTTTASYFWFNLGALYSIIVSTKNKKYIK